MLWLRGLKSMKKITKNVNIKFTGDEEKIKKIKCSCQENISPKTNMIRGYWNCPQCNGTGCIEVS